MLFGWADRQAATGNAYWAPRTGIYRQNGGRGADAVAPLEQDARREQHDHRAPQRRAHVLRVRLRCHAPWDMPGAWQYLNGRTGAWLRADWDSSDRWDGLRDRAIDSIVNRHTPAVIGTGWLSHYPLAFGYAWQQRTVRHCFIWCWDDTVTDRCFYVNHGWGGGGAGEWIDASTWFAGQLYP